MITTMDDSFVFDGSSDGVRLTPEYLLSGILAGLYYLPPEYILKCQSGWGRRIRYDQYCQTLPHWDIVSETSNVRQNFDYIGRATLARTFSFDGIEFSGRPVNF